MAGLEQFLAGLANYLQSTIPQLPAYAPEAREVVRSHVLQCIGSYPGLQVRVQQLAASGSNDGAKTHNLLELVGTIPVDYRSARYNIPVSVRLPVGYPAAGPVSYVVPTGDLVLKPRHSVADVTGLCRVAQYEPGRWNAYRHTVKDVVAELARLFSNEPPLYSRGRPPSPAQPGPPSSAQPAKPSTPSGPTPISYSAQTLPPGPQGAPGGGPGSMGGPSAGSYAGASPSSGGGMVAAAPGVMWHEAWEMRELSQEEAEADPALLAVQLQKLAQADAAKEDALDDTLQGLSNGVSDAEAYCKVVRHLCREQFLTIALLKKVRFVKERADRHAEARKREEEAAEAERRRLEQEEEMRQAAELERKQREEETKRKVAEEQKRKEEEEERRRVQEVEEKMKQQQISDDKVPQWLPSWLAYGSRPPGPPQPSPGPGGAGFPPYPPLRPDGGVAPYGATSQPYGGSTAGGQGPYAPSSNAGQGPYPPTNASGQGPYPPINASGQGPYRASSPQGQGPYPPTSPPGQGPYPFLPPSSTGSSAGSFSAPVGSPPYPPSTSSASSTGTSSGAYVYPAYPVPGVPSNPSAYPLPSQYSYATRPPPTQGSRPPPPGGPSPPGGYYGAYAYPPLSYRPPTYPPPPSYGQPYPWPRS